MVVNDWFGHASTLRISSLTVKSKAALIRHMPAPLPVDDWNEVRTLAIALGSADQAADHFGISRVAVRQRASRGKWFVTHEKALVTAKAIKAQKREDSGMSRNVTTAAEVLANLGPDSKLHAALALNKGAHYFAEMEASELVERADKFKALVGTGTQLHGWGDDPAPKGPLVSFVFNSLPVVPLDQLQDRPVVELQGPPDGSGQH